jgi:hypothetical protein
MRVCLMPPGLLSSETPQAALALPRYLRAAAASLRGACQFGTAPASRLGRRLPVTFGPAALTRDSAIDARGSVAIRQLSDFTDVTATSMFPVPRSTMLRWC